MQMKLALVLKGQLGGCACRSIRWYGEMCEKVEEEENERRRGLKLIYTQFMTRKLAALRMTF